MFSFPILSLPPAKLELKKSEHQFLVKCLIRKKWLVLTPEEWVRQHYIYFLLDQLKIPSAFISIEKSIEYGKLKKRWDILVFSKSHKPLILIECKAPNIALSMSTFLQLLTYQRIIQGTFLGMSNGIENRFYKIITEGENKLMEIQSFPTWD